jgi:hypothetical protein
MNYEFKGTTGEWYIERTSKIDADFQGRILCNQGKEFHAGIEVDKIYIIVGENEKQNGKANIHVEANAKIIAFAPKMFEMLSFILDCQNSENRLAPEVNDEIKFILENITKV